MKLRNTASDVSFPDVLDGARDGERISYVHVHYRASPRHADCASSSLMVLWIFAENCVCSLMLANRLNATVFSFAPDTIFSASSTAKRIGRARARLLALVPL